VPQRGDDGDRRAFVYRLHHGHSAWDVPTATLTVSACRTDPKPKFLIGTRARKSDGVQAIEALPLSGGPCATFFSVRCSADWSGDPIVADKRPDYYAINYPELQAWIEIAHRPLIEVNDAARR